VTYLLDTNVFIEAKNRYYGLDFCPAFWHWLVEQNTAGRVFSIDKVADEIAQGDDELAHWMRDAGAGLFLQSGPPVTATLGVVSTWIMTQSFERAATDTFFQAADVYLIARALAEEHTVVTLEIPSNSFTKIKIPTVCVGLNVRCATPFEMLREERAQFVLGVNGRH
jgi:hypothetical protein